MNLKELCQDIRIESTIVAPDGTGQWSKEATHYSVSLTYPKTGETMVTRYVMGSALKDPPDAADVMYSLICDASGLDQPFESWAGDYGYDADSRKAEAIYKACQANTLKLQVMLGDDFKAFMEAEQDE
jgi:hypothetical protein